MVERDKNCAAFTMSRCDGPMLGLWLSYYSKHVGEQNCYVITDPTDVEVNIVKEQFVNAHFTELASPNGVACDEPWRVQTVRKWQETLLLEYQAVIFSDTDELLIPSEKSLSEFIQTFLESSDEFVKAKGWNVIHHKDEEALSWSPGEKILANRRECVYSYRYNKVNLTKIPLNYSSGFHHIWDDRGVRKHVEFAEGLNLCHLNAVDEKTHNDRGAKRGILLSNVANVGEMMTIPEYWVNEVVYLPPRDLVSP